MKATVDGWIFFPIFAIFDWLKNRFDSLSIVLRTIPRACHIAIVSQPIIKRLQRTLIPLCSIFEPPVSKQAATLFPRWFFQCKLFIFELCDHLKEICIISRLAESLAIFQCGRLDFAAFVQGTFISSWKEIGRKWSAMHWKWLSFVCLKNVHVFYGIWFSFES